MKMAKWILPLLLLVGCGETSDVIDTNCRGYGCAFDAIDTETGIRVRYDVPSYYTLANVSFLYKAVSQCMGAAVINGPLIIFVSHIGYNESGIPYGGYYFSDGLVLVAEQNDYILNHEFIHHALAMTGASDELNFGHQSPEFAGECSFIAITAEQPAPPVGQKPVADTKL